MSLRGLSVSVFFVRDVLRHAPAAGVDVASLLRQSRISPRLLQESSARVAIERFANLQVGAMLAMGDESLGYSARPVPIGAWSMMCHAVIGSETLGQALSRYCRFFGLFDTGSHPVLEVDEERACLRLQRHPDLSPGYFDELSLFNIHRFASWLIQQHLPLQMVSLDFEPRTELSNYRHMFLANPMQFGQDRCSLELSSALLQLPVLQNEQTLRRFLRHPVLMMLTQRFHQDSWTTQVRQIVSRQMLDMPELKVVAEHLDIHPQTLRRRLSAEGSSFKDIKNQVRRDTALHLLGKHGLSIEEIAHRSGFSESSAFIRAFKGWTGVTPYSYRKGL